MTSANPPYPYFNGIKYNKLFFASSSAGLSQSQANALYLQKTVPDAASATETFSNGILTNSIDGISTTLSIATSNSSQINMGKLGGSCTINSLLYLLGAIEPTTSLGQLNMGVSSNGPINIGTSGTRSSSITFGSNNCQINVNGFPSCNYGLALGGSNNLTLGNGTVAPTSNQLGYFTQVLANASGTGSATLNQWTSISPSFTVPTGTWIINVNVATNQNASLSYSVNTTPLTTVNQLCAGNFGAHFSDIVKVAGTYTILGYSYSASTTYVQIYVSLTRIA